MTVTEFESYLQKGLGRAILLLKQDPDKTKFRETALRYLTAGYFNGVTYALDLIDCFEDSDALAKEVAEQNLKQGRTFEEACDVPLLIALGYQNEYTEIIEDHYHTYRDKILSLDKNESFTQDVCGICSRFLGAVYGVLKDTEITKKRVRTILPDLAYYFDLIQNWDLHRGDADVILNYIAPLWDNDTESLLSEISSLPECEFWVKELTKRKTEEPNPDIACDEIMSALPLSRFINDYYHVSFCLASSDVVKEVAERALSTDDISVRADLLSLFAYNQIIGDEFKSPPAFPFPERLIDIATDEIENLKEPADEKKMEYIHCVLGVLNKIRHPRLSVLGRILRSSPPHFSFRGYGWTMMGNNYTIEDREELVMALTESTDIENGNGIFYSALGALLRVAELDSTGLPLELIPSFWADVPHDGWRQKIAEMLLKYDMMPDDIRKECRYDRNIATRKLVEEL